LPKKRPPAVFIAQGSKLSKVYRSKLKFLGHIKVFLNPKAETGFMLLDSSTLRSIQKKNKKTLKRRSLNAVAYL
jgi:hypothetical protein